MQVFSLLADWHRCSSTHHRCPSANNHVANDSSVWQTVPSWFLWYLWASLSLVLAESRWDFNFVACSCGLAVSLWLVCSWWAHSFVRLLIVWDYLNTENDVISPQAVLFFEFFAQNLEVSWNLPCGAATAWNFTEPKYCPDDSESREKQRLILMEGEGKMPTFEAEFGELGIPRYQWGGERSNI